MSCVLSTNICRDDQNKHLLLKLRPRGTAVVAVFSRHFRSIITIIILTRGTYLREVQLYGRTNKRTVVGVLQLPAVATGTRVGYFLMHASSCCDHLGTCVGSIGRSPMLALLWATVASISSSSKCSLRAGIRAFFAYPGLQSALGPVPLCVFEQRC